MQVNNSVYIFISQTFTGFSPLHKYRLQISELTQGLNSRLSVFCIGYQVAVYLSGIEVGVKEICID